MIHTPRRRASIPIRAAVAAAVLLLAILAENEARPQSSPVPSSYPVQQHGIETAYDPYSNGAVPPLAAEQDATIYAPTIEQLPADAPLFYEETPAPFNVPPDPQRPQLPPGAKPGMLQHVGFNYTWLANGGSNGFGFDTIALRTTLGLPLFTRDQPILITPGFGLHLLDGPATVDLPARLHDAYVEFGLPRRLTDRWTMYLSVAPGIYTDFENTSSDMIRITGKGLAIWDWTPQTKLIAGVVYLDRRNVNILPVVGVIYTPNESMRWEITAPRPRFAIEIGDNVWGYIGGELGGGQWAIRRANGADDVLTYNDFRIILGVERKPIDSLGGNVEIGYVFARNLDFASATPDVEPDDTLMLRGGITY